MTAAELAERYGLSCSQASEVLIGTNLFIKACPGAGKTHSIAARVDHLKGQGRRLALTSFTRVGARELQEKIDATDRTVKPSAMAHTSRPFLGTFQSFLRTYVLRPFGHLATGSTHEVDVLPGLAGSYDEPGIKSEDFSFQKDDTLKGPLNQQLPGADYLRKVLLAKEMAARNGVISLNDDVYWSCRTLREYPDLAAAVASRFDEIIVDEAQDLDELQLHALELLCDAGLKSVVLVGDYDQTIYEWRGSKPDLCEKFAKARGLEERRLDENWRSSQTICDVASNFRKNRRPDRAVGPFSSVNVKPKIVFYNHGDEAALPSRFVSIVDSEIEDAQSLAVMVRSNSLAERISGRIKVNVPEQIAFMVEAASSPALNLGHYRNLEACLRQFIGPADWKKFRSKLDMRRASVQLALSLPPVHGQVGDWISSAEDAVRNALIAEGLDDRDVKLIDQPGREKVSGLDVASLLPRDQDSVRIDTVHSFKGESVDAAMLVASCPTPNQARFGYGEAADWAQPILKPVEELSEVHRIAYVALTRAQRILVLALPSVIRGDSKYQGVVDAYLRAGFEIDPSDSRNF